MQRTFSALDTDAVIEQSIDKTAKSAADEQRLQLISGVTSEGKSITNKKTGRDTYSPGYAAYKGKSKPIDLFDKGDFSSGVFADPRKDGFVFGSADEKAAMLEETYGPDIFGLGGEFRNEFMQDELIPVLNKGMEDATGLKFNP